MFKVEIVNGLEASESMDNVVSLSTEFDVMPQVGDRLVWSSEVTTDGKRPMMTGTVIGRKLISGSGRFFLHTIYISKFEIDEDA